MQTGIAKKRKTKCTEISISHVLSAEHDLSLTALVAEASKSVCKRKQLVKVFFVRLDIKSFKSIVCCGP